MTNWHRSEGEMRVQGELDDLKEKLRLSEEHNFRLRHAIVSFLDRPGCNPNQRKLQMRRLRWAANIEESE